MSDIDTGTWEEPADAGIRRLRKYAAVMRTLVAGSSPAGITDANRKGNAMPERPWIPTSERLPDDREIVETKVHDDRGCRNTQPLKRNGRLWFFPDGSMYVYYTPTHWRYVDAKS